MNKNALDIITVPDFEAERCKLFEYRTLFFLASWIETRHLHTKCRLHLACIGQPPETVRYLADKAGADISVHKALAIEGFEWFNSNKFRGFEVDGDASNILLVDTDVFFMSSLDPLIEMGSCISANPAYRARVQEKYWLEIYSALNIAPPKERIESNAHKTQCFQSGTPVELIKENASMLPYYNSGVVLVPRDVDLVSVWEAHMKAIKDIAKSFPLEERIKPLYNGSDQTGFATAIELLKQQGVPFKTLPNRFNAKYLEVANGLFDVNEIAIFHFITFLGMAKSEVLHQELSLRQKLSLSYTDLSKQCVDKSVAKDLIEMIEQLRIKYVVPTFEACGYQRPF